MMKNISRRLHKLNEQIADKGSYLPVIHRDEETGEYSIKEVYFPKIRCSPKSKAEIRANVENIIYALTCNVPQRRIEDFENYI